MLTIPLFWIVVLFVLFFPGCVCYLIQDGAIHERKRRAIDAETQRVTDEVESRRPQ